MNISILSLASSLAASFMCIEYGFAVRIWFGRTRFMSIGLLHLYQRQPCFAQLWQLDVTWLSCVVCDLSLRSHLSDEFLDRRQSVEPRGAMDSLLCGLHHNGLLLRK